jgi:hypothetical protein
MPAGVFGGLADRAEERGLQNSLLQTGKDVRER